MRIVCPACDATYDVPDAMLAARTRAVRCAKCGHEWTPTRASQAQRPPNAADLETDKHFGSASAPPVGPGAAPAGGPDAHGRHESRNPLRPRLEARLAPPPPPDLPPPGRGRAAAIVAWTLSILVLAAAGTAAVAWRTQLMAAWPPSERVFVALGLT